MQLFRIDTKVVRRNIVIRGDEPHGYCKDQWTEQRLVKTVRFLGIPLLRFTADRERIPDHVLIELGTTGYTPWKSKFAAHIA